MLLPPTRWIVMALLVVGVAGCDDPLIAHNVPPPEDCARRGGMWRVMSDGHTGLCRLPPGSRVAGWTIMPHAASRQATPVPGQ
ncbi:hypothetical protein JCM25156A_26130 [Komagataeibacter kakiaceti JCM 25156]|uniref:hypothetical protein n=1 Tax=Komagataeibacter kakiaceti TaxID=943261 RepID=UPI00046F1417|nr:hypothetical protein [Komagataeibacter kakiaceti]